MPNLEGDALSRFKFLVIAEDLNLRAVIEAAQPYFEPEANLKHTDPEWYISFTKQSKDAYSEEMRMVWAKILAEQVNNPNTITKSILHTLSLMDKVDAQAFSSLLNFVCKSDTKFLLLIPDVNGPYFREHGMDFGTLMRLQDLNLIAPSGFAQFASGLEAGTAKVLFDYWGVTITLPCEQLEDGTSRISLGYFRLSRDGEILAKTVGNNDPLADFPDWISKKYSS